MAVKTLLWLSLYDGSFMAESTFDEQCPLCGETPTYVETDYDPDRSDEQVQGYQFCCYSCDIATPIVYID